MNLVDLLVKLKLQGKEETKNGLKEVGNTSQETATKVESNFTKMSKKMEGVGKSFTAVGKFFAPFSALASGALVGATKSASDFQNGMAKMSTLFDTTKTDVNKLSKEFLNLSNETGKSATELAEAGYQALSASVPIENVGKFVKTSANLAKVGFTDSATAVDVLTTTINAYKLSADDANGIANKLVKTQNLGKTTVAELASTMGRVIPTASSMGVNIDNLCTSYALMTKQGINTAQSTTYMSAMLNELGDSGSDVSKVLKKQTGKSFQELMSDGKSLGDVLGILQDSAKKSGTNFSELWSNTNSGKGALALLTGGAEEFNSTLSTMSDNTDVLSEGLEKLRTPSAILKSSFNKIKNSLIELGQVIIEQATPYVEKFADFVEKATKSFNGMDDGSKKVIIAILGIVASIAPVLLGFGKLFSTASQVAKGFGKIADKVGPLSSKLGGLKGIFGALTSPIGLVVVAIGILIGVFVHLYNTNDEFRRKVNKTWELVKEKIGTVIDGIKGLIDAFVQLFKKVWDKWGDNIMSTVNSVFDFVASYIQTALDVISGIIQVVTDIINGDWNKAWDDIKQVVSTVWDGIKDLVKKGFEVVKDVFKTVTTALKDIWKKAWDTIKDKVSNVVNDVKEKVKQKWNEIKDNTKNTWDNIKQDTSTKWDSIKQSVNEKAQALKDGAKSKWEELKQSTSSAWDNIKSNTSGKWEGIKTTVSNAVGNVVSNVSSRFSGLTGTVSGIWNGVKNAINNPMQTAVNLVKGAVSKLKGALNFHWSLPPLKLPHISVSGGKAPFGIGGRGSLPHFSIQWYKKAMDEPYILDKPTIFGQSQNGQFLGGGESGQEVISGKQKLYDMIQEATNGGNEDILNVLNNIYARLCDESRIHKILVDALSDGSFSVVLDNREIGRIVRKYA